jgi:hypothetical protein
MSDERDRTWNRGNSLVRLAIHPSSFRIHHSPYLLPTFAEEPLVVLAAVVGKGVLVVFPAAMSVL